jgi:hypothetical protein
MGTYVNPGNEGFAGILSGEYVDKTGLIAPPRPVFPPPRRPAAPPPAEPSGTKAVGPRGIA